MQYNQIIKYNLNQNKFPLTKKFDSNEINDKKQEITFRSWDPSRSSLSAAVACGLEIMPINETSSLLYIGKLDFSESLNLLDLVRGKKKIFCMSETNLKLPKQENFVKINKLSEIQNQRFSVIYIDCSDYSSESLTEISNFYLKNSGYLLIQYLKLTKNSDNLFKNISKKFQVIQEVNIESFFKNKSLMLLKTRN
tara:strand:- start:3151 stop:3735 length:585 start_codon:yes stop_codon:yes gene_type:complete